MQQLVQAGRYGICFGITNAYLTNRVCTVSTVTVVFIYTCAIHVEYFLSNWECDKIFKRVGELKEISFSLAFNEI